MFTKIVGFHHEHWLWIRRYKLKYFQTNKTTWSGTLKGCLHETGNKISFRYKNEMKTWNEMTTWNEIHFCSNLLIYYFYCYEVFAWADVFSMVISFPGSVYITFITRNDIPFLYLWYSIFSKIHANCSSPQSK